MITGMHPLTIASNNLADDGVSPAGLRQKIDLMTRETIKYIKHLMTVHKRSFMPKREKFKIVLYLRMPL